MNHLTYLLKLVAIPALASFAVFLLLNLVGTTEIGFFSFLRETYPVLLLVTLFADFIVFLSKGKSFVAIYNQMVRTGVVSNHRV